MAHFGKPPLKWFGLGARDGLDNAEGVFRVDDLGLVLLAVGGGQFQLSTKCRQLDSRGFLLATLHAVPVISWVIAVGQGGDDVHNGEEPLFIVPNAANLLRPENNHLALCIRGKFLTHFVVSF